MTAPNIVGITSLSARTQATKLTNTNATVLLSNAVSSNQAFKINSVVVANISASSADITLSHNSAAAGAGTATLLAKSVTIPTQTTLVVLDKSIGIYLEENTSLVVTASASNALDVVCSYEIIT
jgi:hypothetical protein